VNEPENMLAVTLVLTNKEFKVAFEPDTMTFFQFGMLFYNLFCG
jgi:hypothetical protein